MDAILMGVDREHLESAVSEGLGRGDRLVSFGTEIYPEPLSFPANVPAFFYEVRADAANVAAYGARFVRYEADSSTREFRRQLDATRPSTTLRRRDPSLPLEEQEPWWGGYLFFTDLERLPRPIPLARFRIGNRPFAGTVVRRPLVVDWPG